MYQASADFIAFFLAAFASVGFAAALYLKVVRSAAVVPVRVKGRKRG